jgi:hypothetical protein
MTVRAEKPSVNLREKLAELDKPTGIAGEAMLRAETPQEQFNLIGAGRRNLIINGAYQVWQRGSSATTASDGLFLADRFKLFEGTDGSFTTERSTDAPEGFGYSNKLQVTTADTSLASSQYVQYTHYIEGQDLQQLAYGTSAAKYVTLSFWVKSSKTGSYGFTLKKTASTIYQYPTMFTIDFANTWEKKVIVIPPLTTGGLLPNDNTIGVFLSWNLAFGSTYTNATADKWTTTGVDYSTSEQVNWMDSTSNDFYITGVQLEVGKVATPFEHRSYGEELALCQRYYEVLYADSEAAANVSAFTTTAAYGHMKMQPKRAAPTMLVSAASTFRVRSAGNNLNLTSIGFNEPTATGNVRVNCTTSGLVVGDSGWLSRTSNGTAYIHADAEL